MKKYRAPPAPAILASDMWVSISICAGMFVFLYFCLFLSFSNPLCVCHWMYEQWDHYCVWRSDYIPDFLNLQPILRCPNDIFLIHFLCSTVFFSLTHPFGLSFVFKCLNTERLAFVILCCIFCSGSLICSSTLIIFWFLFLGEEYVFFFFGKLFIK